MCSLQCHSGAHICDIYMLQCQTYRHPTDDKNQNKNDAERPATAIRSFRHINIVIFFFLFSICTMFRISFRLWLFFSRCGSVRHCVCAARVEQIAKNIIIYVGFVYVFFFLSGSVHFTLFIISILSGNQQTRVLGCELPSFVCLFCSLYCSWARTTVHRSCPISMKHTPRDQQTLQSRNCNWMLDNCESLVHVLSTSKEHV